MTRKKTGIIILEAGLSVILSAVILLLFNIYEDRTAGDRSGRILEEIYSHINVSAEETPIQLDLTGSVSESLPNEVPEEMKEVTVDGFDYIGYISVTELNIELPVMSDWDYYKLKISPCRQFGSVYTNDLVIAAHNYKTHFKYIGELSLGSDVLFTDMDGNVTYYKVAEIGIYDPEDVSSVKDSGYGLVLYTCTSDTFSRIVVFCEKETAAFN